MHVIEVLGFITGCLAPEHFLALMALAEQVIYGHQDLPMLCGFLHLLRGLVLALSHQFVLQLLDLVQSQLFVSYLVVQRHLHDRHLFVIDCYLLVDVVQVLHEAPLVLLQSLVRQLQCLVARQNVV